MDFNALDIQKLAELLKPEESSSDSDDGLPKAGVSRFGPGDIGSKVKFTGKGDGIKGGEGDLREKTENIKKSDKDIWDESEIPDGIQYDESDDPREKPEYEIKYKQSVSAEEMFLQMGNKTPGTASCEDMIVEIKLPGENRSQVDLNIVKQCLDLRSPKFRLSLPLPHPVDPDSTKAVWNSDSYLLTVTLRLKREFDFVVMSQGSTLVSETPLYNDNQWHAITATHDRDGLKLSVDDFETFNNERVPTPPSFKFGSLFVGGVPEGYPVGLGKLGSTAPFSGCIGDVTFNGVLVNFANATERDNVIVGKCSETETPSAVIPHGAPTIPGEEDGETLPEPAKKITPGPIPGPETAIRKPSEGPTTPVPTPANLCALPPDPAPDPTDDFAHGYRFGTQNGSRLEYRNPTLGESDRKKLKQINNFIYTLDFKTNYADGILFYSTGKRHIDFVGLYIKGGRIHFGFNSGSGSALIVGEERFDDGQWHTVMITKENTTGNLTIDGIHAGSGVSAGTTKTLNLIPTFYIGGIDPSIAESAKTNLKGLNQSFEGCIRKIQLNGKPVDTFTRIGVVPCAQNVEPGVFFASGGGFVRAIDSFRVGSNIDIKMDIKPRSTSGVLLAVHGKRDYLLLQMVDGVIKFTVDNGKGPITSSFKPPKDEFLFCDGNWHQIHAVQAKNVVVLSVDSENSDPGIGVPGSTSTDTKSPLFVGSAGPKGLRQRGTITPHQYIGCIRNILINDNPIKLPPHRAFGNVTVSACPTI